MLPIENGVNQIGQPVLTFSCETTYATNFNIVPFLVATAANTRKHETIERARRVVVFEPAMSFASPCSLDRITLPWSEKSERLEC